MRLELWSKEELDIIRELGGRYCGNDILDRINAHRQEHGLAPRGISAMHAQAERYDISLYPNPALVLTKENTKRLLGCGTVSLRTWRANGWLVGRTWDAAGTMTVHEVAEVEQFVRDRPWLIDIQSMPPSSVRDAAVQASRSDPWLRLSTFAALFSISVRIVREYVGKGLLRAKQRPCSVGMEYVAPLSEALHIHQSHPYLRRVQLNWSALGPVLDWCDWRALEGTRIAILEARGSHPSTFNPKCSHNRGMRSDQPSHAHVVNEAQRRWGSQTIHKDRDPSWRLSA